MRLRNQRCQSEPRGRGLEGGAHFGTSSTSAPPPLCPFDVTLAKTLRIACFTSLLQRSLPPPRFTHVRLYPRVGVRRIPVHRCYWTVNTAGPQPEGQSGGGVCTGGGGYWCKNTLRAEKSLSRILASHRTSKQRKVESGAWLVLAINTHHRHKKH